jgi:hypothetical protein
MAKKKVNIARLDTNENEQ